MIWSMRSSRRGSALGKTCRHSLRFTLGNLQSFRSYQGFISITCVLVGVPRILMTSIRWSMLLSPTNRGVPQSISRRTQPRDQISIMVEQWLAPKMSSGARQHREQMQGRLGSLVSILADPKSQTTSRPFWTRRLWGLMSLWQMLSEWMQSSPLKAWQEQSLISKGDKGFLWQRMQEQRSDSQYSMTMFRYWLAPYSVVKVPNTRMVKSPQSKETISTYLFLYLGSWKTRLTATICPVLRTRDLQTCPKVPCPTRLRCQRSDQVRFLGVQSKVPDYFSRTSQSALLHQASFFPRTVGYLCSRLGFSFSSRRLLFFYRSALSPRSNLSFSIFSPNFF